MKLLIVIMAMSGVAFAENSYIYTNAQSQGQYVYTQPQAGSYSPPPIQVQPQPTYGMQNPYLNQGALQPAQMPSPSVTPWYQP